jgi:hypothetical protein
VDNKISEINESRSPMSDLSLQYNSKQDEGWPVWSLEMLLDHSKQTHRPNSIHRGLVGGSSRVDSSDFWRKKRNKWPVFVMGRTGRDKGHIQMSLIRIWFIFYLEAERGIHRPPGSAMGVT